VARTGEFVEGLRREAERREESATLLAVVAEIGGAVRERLQAGSSGSGSGDECVRRDSRLLSPRPGR
jgi:hypothetical protein